MEPTATSIWEAVTAIRRQAPLVHNITNYVVMNNTANALLALGASPVMAHAENEASEMAVLAGALVVNIGTLSDPWIRAMRLAVPAARARHIPVVLDPVGAGATAYRTQTVRELISLGPPTILRGNASEIMAVHQDEARTKGVDSAAASSTALAAARAIHQRHGCIVSISGETDYVVHEGGTLAIRNGHPMMPRVTGLGCTASALCGAFAAVERDAALATAAAMAVMGVAGEMAAEGCPGPGSFQVRFLDALYSLTEEDLRRRLRIAPENG
ncbi:MAG: hydroxyethylthiazole kinase [Syntrophales bacterium]|jgi:hydroxyethylthiazole kinase|nr:hydroxyethylthiazole kinase [Syntrophales bacterium]MDD4338183.1 hydroxyethylthiazole kinase [Syntrophales bacterium]HQN25516.1 hydroxyethylthiazole kinase [Syntrophales bacterium]HQP29003.1 hydroxyethylthiazole kinase [Syntrophales bacterium]